MPRLHVTTSLRLRIKLLPHERNQVGRVTNYGVDGAFVHPRHFLNAIPEDHVPCWPRHSATVARCTDGAYGLRSKRNGWPVQNLRSWAPITEPDERFSALPTYRTSAPVPPSRDAAGGY